jgi:hypothetical protein
MVNKILMKLDTPQSIASRQNSAYQYFVQQQQKQSKPTLGVRKNLSSPMIERVHSAKPGCGSCGK